MKAFEVSTLMICESKERGVNDGCHCIAGDSVERKSEKKAEFVRRNKIQPMKERGKKCPSKRKSVQLPRRDIR